jgi:acetyltransferase-like isoleucine patch superfamily enzyme
VVTGGRIVIGRRLAIRAFQAPVELGAVNGGALTIGDRVFLNAGVSVVANVGIEIGDHARIGEYTAIFDSDYHPVDQAAPMRTAPVRLGINVWVGRAVIILPGSIIGDHSVVAAGSVVTRPVPERSLVGGNPARVIRQLTADDDWRRD